MGLMFPWLIWHHARARPRLCGEGGANRPWLGDGRMCLYSLVCVNVLYVGDEVYVDMWM